MTKESHHRRDLARRLDKKEGGELTLYGSEKFQIVGIYFSRKPLENRSLIIPLTKMIYRCSARIGV